jgi:hypothetical protein
MNYEVAFVEDFIDKKNNFVEVCVYDNEAYQRIFQITKYENGYTTLADNCNNLRAIDNYRLMKTLNSDLKTKVPSAKREKI